MESRPEEVLARLKKKRSRRRLLNRITALSAYAVLGTILALIILYYIFPWVIPERRGCAVDVIDVYGILSPITKACHYRGADIQTLRAIGRTSADVIVLVTHFFTDGEHYGLGSNENVTLKNIVKNLPFVPFMVKGYPVTGTLNNLTILSTEEKYLALTPRGFMQSPGLDGKIVVLISCPGPGLEEFAHTFIGKGAKMVIFGDSTKASADYLVYEVVSSYWNGTISKLCDLEYFECWTTTG